VAVVAVQVPLVQTVMGLQVLLATAVLEFKSLH
jgi:hypothetical protein